MRDALFLEVQNEIIVKKSTMTTRLISKKLSLLIKTRFVLNKTENYALGNGS